MSKSSDSVSQLIECYRDDVQSIMSDIESILTDRGFEFTSNTKKTEFIIMSTNKEEILDLIYTNINLPTNVTDVFISVKKSNHYTYVRQRVK